MSRTLKQFLIGGIYVIIIAGVSYFYYSSEYGPTCFDSVRNGQEEGIDCGALACGVACRSPIQALKVQSVNIVKTPVGDHDVALKFYNPNTDYGIEIGTYDLVLADNLGKEVARTSGHQFYMLPGQTKYFVVTSIKNIPDGSTVKADIQSIKWAKVSGQPQINLTTTSDSFSVSGSQTTFETTVNNNSDFDFDVVDVAIAVYDRDGLLLATNMTKVQTLLSLTDRYVKLSWPFALPADAVVYIEVGTNVFNNSNFLKYNGTQEKFQQFF